MGRKKFEIERSPAAVDSPSKHPTKDQEFHRIAEVIELMGCGILGLTLKRRCAMMWDVSERRAHDFISKAVDLLSADLTGRAPTLRMEIDTVLCQRVERLVELERLAHMADPPDFPSAIRAHQAAIKATEIRARIHGLLKDEVQHSGMVNVPSIFELRAQVEAEATAAKGEGTEGS